MPNEFEELQKIQEARKAQLKEVGGIVYTNPPGIAVEGEDVVVDEAAKELQVPSGRDEIVSPAQESADESSEAPSPTANKGEWVAYRMETHGLSEDEANAKSKKELIDLP